MKKKKLIKNTIASLVFEVVALICGFILPRLILKSYGSQVNGLVNSITQFLQIIAFFEMGVGAVVQSTLYKPLAENDETMISQIMKSAKRFFDFLAILLFVYILILIIVYPFLVNNQFSWLYTVLLILAMSISSFSQYYFGVSERLLLTADQRGYVQYNAQTIVLILNTMVCAILIIKGVSLQAVKLTTSCIYLLRPLYLRLYVNKKYRIDRKIEYTEEPIKQKKNGIAQHIAAVILNNTDTVVLTVFSTLSNVSIYAVYNMVVFGVKQLFTSMTTGIQAVFGELFAKKEHEQLRSFFNRVEWTLHTLTTIVFGCTAVLIVPFVMIYTRGVTDADYCQPLFAVLITMAHAFHCLRLPYNIMILAGGHYKQTQNNYIIAAILNIVISILAVTKFGLIGVAIGTLVAMAYQTIWMAYYDSKNFIFRPILFFYKQIATDALVALIASLITINIKIQENSYLEWFGLALVTFLIWVAVSLFINSILYKNQVANIFMTFKRKMCK